MSAKYKDSLGRFRTDSLFKEQCYGRGLEGTNLEPIYTLKDQDDPPHISAKRIFMEASDLTGYRAAMELVGSWAHWQRLMRNEWFREKVEEWTEELEIKLRSDAVHSIRNISNKETATGLNAAKFIATKGWDTSKEKTRGRPSKEEVARERRIAAGIDAEITETLNNING